MLLGVYDISGGDAPRWGFMFLPSGRLRAGPSTISQVQTCAPAGDAGAGVTFCRQKVTKDRQRRGLPPPCGIHPAVLGGVCALLFSDLGPARSHRRRGHSTERACSSGRQYFYRQGLILVSRCSQLSGARLPVAGTPLSQGRPGYGNHPAIGPAAQGSLVWWHKQEPQQG